MLEHCGAAVMTWISSAPAICRPVACPRNWRMASTCKAQLQVEQMLGWIAAGRFSPHIHPRFAFAQCVAALETLAARQIVGKCVITTRAG
jgi:NADPH:quinone reductase-like Zn-dependent oxidoreductase